MKTKQSAVQFFYENAGYYWDTKTESQEQGHKRCAKLYARAERWLSQQPGHTIEWEEDSFDDRTGIDHDAPLFCCCVKANGQVASLCGIDLGPNADLSCDYTRVVVAELATELMD